ncbi:universal stress protein [Thalassotalea fonticola]|uniref:Universal stress protein n=1 Tax=Thalassotalea fonticola TaxID=3065649 RepID=A0ABZ0GN89_9GAMM|nr:universal stress protein [Colwelliaceae bacterium S1-1]
MSKLVLVIADIEDDDILSLEKARDITLPMRATVEIIKFIHPSNDSDITLEQHIEQAKQSLNSNIKSIFDGESKITSEVIISDNIADWVVNRCVQQPVDLVIKGGHRSESLFHTPSDWTLTRHLPCPILIASHVKWNSKTNILLALDLSTDEKTHQQLNSLILGWGKALSGVTHNQLHAMYSIPIAKPLLEFDVVNKHSVKQKKAPAATEKMQQLLADFDMSYVTNHITAGPPDRTIPHQANELNSDLVIIGCVGREGVSGFFLGNLAEKVMHHLRTDCLIIKPAQN